MNRKIVFNPFEKHSEITLLIFGLTLTTLGSFIGYLMKARFDGIIDMHLVENISLIEPFLDNLLNTLSLFVLFFILGKSINKKTRWVDILSASIIARIPFYILPLFKIGGFLEKITERLLESIDLENLNSPPAISISDMLTMLLFAGIGIVCLCWFIALFWNGFRVATNTKGTKNIILFVIMLIVAEVISKFLIAIL